MKRWAIAARASRPVLAAVVNTKRITSCALHFQNIPELHEVNAAESNVAHKK